MKNSSLPSATPSTDQVEVCYPPTDGKVVADSDRGDVPGWVLITLMTAALVVVLWGLAAPALSQVFNQAMNKVVSF